jgi:hypothetical protein
MRGRLISVASMLLVCGGCSCGDIKMEKIHVFHERDPYLSCKQLDYSINYLDVKRREAQRRQEEPYKFANRPYCMFQLKQDAQQQIYRIDDRVEHLYYIMRKKSCPQVQEQRTFEKDEFLYY